MDAERAQFEAAQNVGDIAKKDKLFHVESDGILPVCAGVDRSRYRPGEDRDPAFRAERSSLWERQAAR